MIKKTLLILFSIFVNLYSFQGQGECVSLLSDYAILKGKSVFLPSTLNGNCVVKNENDFPLVMRSAGFNYKEKDRVIDVTAIVPWSPKPWTPKPKQYRISFAFLNVSSAIDCGLTLNDVLFSFENLQTSFSIGGSLGCPALDRDGSFALSVNAKLMDKWSYTHGTEISRPISQITSASGAVTTEYKYITSGLDLSLEQTEQSVFYTLRYTSSTGSVTTSRGALVPLVIADVEEVIKTQRKLWFIPLGWSTENQKFRLILQMVEDIPLTSK